MLKAILVLTGLAAALTGVLQMVLRDQSEGCAFPCSTGNQVENAIASMVWFSIAIALWIIAGLLAWMQRRFDQLSI